MPEFKKVASAVRSPTQCALCHSHEGPFIDTELLLPVYGHVYICMANEHRSGCLRQMARLDGMVDGDRYSEKVAEIAMLERALADSEERERSSRVVPMEEVLAHLNITQGNEFVQPVVSSSNRSTRSKPKES
jgi:hypothetical protein